MRSHGNRANIVHNGTIYASIQQASQILGVSVSSISRSVGNRNVRRNDFTRAPVTDLDQEEWREYGKLLVSNLGRIQGSKRHILRTTVIGGYLRVRTSGISEAVHRIVAKVWIGPPPSDKHVVNHINHDKIDNRACNLEWLTHRENCAAAETYYSNLTWDGKEYRALNGTMTSSEAGYPIDGGYEEEECHL